jgi:hypothetical protein
MIAPVGSGLELDAVKEEMMRDDFGPINVLLHLGLLVGGARLRLSP